MHFEPSRFGNDEPVYVNFEQVAWIEPAELVDARGNRVKGSRLWFVGGTRLDLLKSPQEIFDRLRGMS